MNKKILIEAGVDYADGVARFMGDDSLYEMILASFIDDQSLPRSKDAFEKRDLEALMNVVHEIKGVSGNLSLTTLYKAACAVVDTLRNSARTDEMLVEAYKAYEEAYNAIKAALKAASES